MSYFVGSSNFPVVKIDKSVQKMNIMEEVLNGPWENLGLSVNP